MYLSKLIPFEISDHDQLTFVSVVVQCYPLIMIGIFKPFAEFFYIILIKITLELGNTELKGQVTGYLKERYGICYASYTVSGIAN